MVVRTPHLYSFSCTLRCSLYRLGDSFQPPSLLSWHCNTQPPSWSAYFSCLSLNSLFPQWPKWYLQSLSQIGCPLCSNTPTIFHLTQHENLQALHVQVIFPTSFLVALCLAPSILATVACGCSVSQLDILPTQTPACRAFPPGVAPSSHSSFCSNAFFSGRPSLVI